MNVLFYAKRRIYTEDFNEDYQEEMFGDEIQTPTDITSKIIRSDNPVDEYVNYLQTIKDSENNDYIDYHIEEFKKWVNIHIKNGFEIKATKI